MHRKNIFGIEHAVHYSELILIRNQQVAGSRCASVALCPLVVVDAGGTLWSSRFNEPSWRPPEAVDLDKDKTGL